MEYCPHCGEEVEAGATFCPSCGNKLEPEYREGGKSRSAGEHLSIAFNLATKQPMVFIPAILGGIIDVLVGRAVVGIGYYGLSAAIIGIIGTTISFILNFASIDMSRDAYQDKPLNLGESVSYVTGRFFEFIVAAIIGGLMAITIILIPVVILMFVIMVIDETGITSSISKAFSVLGAELGDIILILLISIIGSFLLGFVPIGSGLLQAAFNVIISLALVDLYYNYKRMH